MEAAALLDAFLGFLTIIGLIVIVAIIVTGVTVLLEQLFRRDL